MGFFTTPRTLGLCPDLREIAAPGGKMGADIATIAAFASIPHAVNGVTHIEPEGSIIKAAEVDHFRRSKALVPCDAATRLFNHERLESVAPAPAPTRVLVAAICSFREPTPNAPGKHLPSHAGTSALAPRLELTRARATARRLGVDRTCVRARE